MSRILGTAFVLIIVVLLAAPFVREAYHRYELAQDLQNVLSERDRVAFQEWKGDAVSFGRSLLERCERDNGRGSPACQPYQRFAQR
ncbi:MAG TPA: hypothetical protein VFA12_03455 [Stellaceae bacterium]|nr:hypothetical protein [Stellaceae bacterium]